MSVTLSGSGGVFTRFGRLAGGASDVVALAGGTATARVLSGGSMATRGTNIESDAANSPAVSAQVDGHWNVIDAWRSSQSSLFQGFKGLAEKIIVRQVDLDASLPTLDLTTALKELIRQMVANSDSLNASTVAVGSQTSVGTPNGNPIFVTSIKNNAGATLQTVFAEVIRLQVSGDSQNGSTLRQEPFTVKGKTAVSDPFAYNWPGGSGCNVTLNLVDAQLDNSGGQMLVNGDFETFTTASYPDNWVIAIGAAATDVFAAGSSDAHTQSNALKITGDGSTLVAVHQQFNTAVSTSAGAGGTPATLKPSTTYAVEFKLKAITSAPAAGVLRVALVDGSNAVINDDAATANSFTVTLSGITTSFVSYSGVFRTPSVLPSAVRLQFKTTTAVTSAKSVVIDDVAFAAMTQLYNGGPFVAGFAGATKVITNDAWTVTTTNTMGALVMWLERFFGLRDRGLQFPVSGSPTVSDSLVT